MAVASGVALASKQIKWNQCFDPADCAKCGSRRIGEASHPGPRRTRARGAASLDDIELVEPKTLLIQDKVWQSFLRWLTELISPGAARSAMASPELLSLLLKEYGYHQYASGMSLFSYRHLVVFVQKNLPLVKLHLGGCWDTITKWELAEPTVHRVPIPFVLVRAILSVGLLWRWTCFSCIVAMAFFGIARPGEPLKATREDLVLPSDRLDGQSSLAFLRIRNPKTRKRGKGVVQHLSIEEPGVVKLLEKTYSSFAEGAALCPMSSSSFRRRWDAILEYLQIPSRLEITPGGLRGGGCVHAFNCGTDLPRLMWKMRIKHQGTLESYLQEVVAATVLNSLSPQSRQHVGVAASLLDTLLT